MADLKLYGEVGWEVSAAMVRMFLEEAGGGPINVRIDSPGGSVFEGFSIYTALKNYPGRKTAIIESAAFSIASYIAMACDEIAIAPNGYFMLHNPSMNADGDAGELGKQAELLAKLKTSMVESYVARTGKDVDQVDRWLNEETFFDASEAVAAGLADRMTSEARESRVVAIKSRLPKRVVASLYGTKEPSDKVHQPQPSENPVAEENKEPKAATVAEIRSAFPKLKAESVLNYIERQLPLASVAAEAAKELMAENEELKAKLEAMEEEMAKASAEAAASAEAMEDDEEEEMEAKAKATGSKPVAVAGGASESASQRWKAAIAEQTAKGLPRERAVLAANRSYPGLRKAYLEEINAS